MNPLWPPLPSYWDSPRMAVLREHIRRKGGTFETFRAHCDVCKTQLSMKFSGLVYCFDCFTRPGP